MDATDSHGDEPPQEAVIHFTPIEVPTQEEDSEVSSEDRLVQHHEDSQIVISPLGSMKTQDHASVVEINEANSTSSCQAGLFEQSEATTWRATFVRTGPLMGLGKLSWR
jgi:hypothetical protein